MSRKKTWSFLVLVLYLATWVLDAGATNANFVCSFPTLHGYRWNRDNLVFAISWSAFPVIPVVITPIFTGFYMDGWTLSGTCPHEAWPGDY